MKNPGIGAVELNFSMQFAHMLSSSEKPQLSSLSRGPIIQKSIKSHLFKQTQDLSTGRAWWQRASWQTIAVKLPSHASTFVLPTAGHTGQ